MAGLEGIEINSEALSGNVAPVLHEISALLKQLLHSGEGGTVDLHSLPLTPDDQRLLRRQLGEGEVAATLDSLGRSEIRETGITGVWWVSHFNANGELMAEFVEVTAIPEILKSDPADIEQALLTIEERLKF